MTVPSTDAFIQRFPEFGAQSPWVIEGALAEAGRSVPTSVWTTTHTEAVSYLAAHLLATRTIQIGQQVGSPTGTAMGEGFNATLYGQEYKRLLGSLPITGFAL